MGESSDSGGGNDEPQGTVFGVDGVSKTGSTSQDQQIGYTDGQGGKGANFDALQGATSQQTSAAVAAANKTKASGGNETAQQAAVSNVLESYDPGFVNRSGNLTESGQSAINRAAQEAIEDTAESERIQASAPPAGAALANIGDVTQPSMDQNLLTSLDLGPQASLADPEAAALRSRVPDPNRPLTVAEERNLVNMFSEAGLDPAAGQEAERQRQAQQQQALNAINSMLGITSLPEAATAAAVLQGDSDLAMMNRRLARDPEGAAGPPQFIETSRSPVRTISPNPLVDRGLESVSGYLDYPGTERDREVYAPLIVAGTTMSPTQYADAQAFALAEPFMGMGAGDFNFGTGTTTPASAPVTDAGLYGGYEDDPAYDADIFGVPRYAGGKTGLDGQMQGFSDARQMGDFVSSATEGNFLTDIMSFLPGLDPVEANRNNVRDMMEAGAQFNQESGKLELDTGRGTLRMSDSGVVTYSGMPNPDYTGPFGNLVNPPAQTGDDEAMTTDVAKSPQDPCPPGYTLVNGVCQPVDDVTTAPPGSGFQFFPSGGFPTSFQPVTQATQVGQVNPFVLRPNVPQGIQGLSPTGAALGRQV